MREDPKILVECSEHGDDLYIEETETADDGTLIVRVSTCSRCDEQAYGRGVERVRRSEGMR